MNIKKITLAGLLSIVFVGQMISSDWLGSKVSARIELSPQRYAQAINELLDAQSAHYSGRMLQYINTMLQDLITELKQKSLDSKSRNVLNKMNNHLQEVYNASVKQHAQIIKDVIKRFGTNLFISKDQTGQVLESIKRSLAKIHKELNQNS